MLKRMNPGKCYVLSTSICVTDWAQVDSDVILEVPCIALHDPSVLSAEVVALSVLMNCSTILPHLGRGGVVSQGRARK